MLTLVVSGENIVLFAGAEITKFGVVEHPE